MPGLIDNLIEKIEIQDSIYKEIIELLLEKKQIIINNDIQALREIVDKENSTTARALKVEKDRESIMKNISIVLNKAQEELTFDFLIDSLEGKQGQNELRKIVFEIRKTSKKMKEINDSVKKLIENALEYIDYSINAIHTSNAINQNNQDYIDSSSFLDING